MRAFLAATAEVKDVRLDRALGSVLALVCGDSLGAPLEFSAVQYNTHELHTMGQAPFWGGGKAKGKVSANS